MKTKKDHFWIYTLRSAVTRSLFIFQITCVTSVLGKLSGMTLDQYNEILLTIYQPQNFRFHLFQLQYSAVSRRTAKWVNGDRCTLFGIPSFPAAILSCVQKNSKMRTAKWVNGDRCTLFGMHQYTSQWNWSVRRITYRSSQILVHKSCERSPVSNNIFNLSKL